MNKNTQGGKRSGAGRKPIDDKKKTICLYVRRSTIQFHGGERYLKELCYKAIEPNKSEQDY